MILNGQALLEAAPIVDMSPAKHSAFGVSWGLTECGYDIRLAQDVTLFLGRRFVLASAMEEFQMPTTLMGRVLNKSTWARKGIDASMTTNIEPGWRGFLTLEIRYAGVLPIFLPRGAGIAQVIFETLHTSAQYRGKYQDQASMPIPAIIKDLL